jgi:hypothetical protein
MELVIGLVLFAALGLALGYTVPGWPAWLGLIVPVIFAILTIFLQGFAVSILLVLVLSLLVMAAAILAGRWIDARLHKRREEEPAA